MNIAYAYKYTRVGSFVIDRIEDNPKLMTKTLHVRNDLTHTERDFVIDLSVPYGTYRFPTADGIGCSYIRDDSGLIFVKLTARSVYMAILDEAGVYIPDPHVDSMDRPKITYCCTPDDRVSKPSVYSDIGKAARAALNGISDRFSKPAAHVILTDHRGLPPVRDVRSYNDRVTIVFWKDGTSTKAVCSENDIYSFDTGVVICLAKKLLGGENPTRTFCDYIKRCNDIVAEHGKEKESAAEEKQKRIETEKKRQDKIKAKKDKAREERIDEMAEAYNRAFEHQMGLFSNE